MNKNKLSLLAATIVSLFSTSAFAQSGAASNAFDAQAMAALGAGIAIGLGIFGAGMGQGRAAASALEGISRNPGAASRIQTPMIIALALIESLALFALVIAFFLQQKVPGLE